MKRDRDRGKMPAAAPPSGSTGMWAEKQQQEADAGMDELFAVLGYKVKASDMAEVAEKLEQLDMAMGTTTMEEYGGSVLSTDTTVHYNPSDLSGWVKSMLSELNNSSNTFDVLQNQIEISGDDDLRAIPGGAVLSNSNHKQDDDEEDLESDNSNNKRLKSEFIVNCSPAAAAVLVDSQETGVRLVHTLIACAEAVQQENMKMADALVKHVGVLAVSQIGAMRKVATYFAEALARKIYRIYPRDPPCSDALLHMQFYETAPYLKFAHFAANQAILDAYAGETRVHIVDFGLNQGMQWPALIQALALRPEGPPAFRLTGIGENSDQLQEVGLRLGQMAETLRVKFEFRGLVCKSLADLDVNMLDLDPSFAVAVNSVFEIHRSLARVGGIEKVLNSIRVMKPKIVTVVEQEANHNDDVFLNRFNEALHYYSTMFDSLESSELIQSGGQDLVMAEVYLGRQICDVVACEGAERVERHETLTRWRVRMNSAGFEPVHLGSNAFKQASMLLALFAGADGYRVEENEGCLMLGWHTRPLIATSAWRLTAVE
ncbi:hypothetical protein BUALT_Bualt11G0027000 [Buddleja alternifolia]|uniref:DELLA protein n=1 Tax=Buddleja alternifolia TaxID=168488 RepID=A0AAV6WTQ2_9LAMI|nr:hypothetical protein BUALT_Bualt11G0027000 [Buddleja alternifolia]